MATPDGKEASISDHVGKNRYVLVDFWASWCAPCRAEMPGLLKLYNLYKKKGLEIVGVSFDSKAESWTKAIKELKLPWPQMSDLKGWDSEGPEFMLYLPFLMPSFWTRKANYRARIAR